MAPRSGIKQVNAAGASKQDRLNTAKQLRNAKREELLERSRLGGCAHPPPKVVVVIPFHTQADAVSLKRAIMVACGTASDVAAVLPPHAPAVTTLPNWAQGQPGSGKPRLLIVDPPRDIMAVLDVAKTADMILCVLGPHATLEEPAFDDHGYRLLTALKAQGMPVVIGAIHGPEAMDSSAKKAAEARKFVTRYFATELGGETRLFPACNEDEVKALVRHLGAVTPKDITWRADRGYTLASQAEYISAEGCLLLRGYVRGPGFRCKRSVHLTGHGDFTLRRIAIGADPCPLGAERKGMEASPEDKVVDELPAGQDPDRVRLQPYDPSTAEQTWPTSEEMGEMPPPPRPRKKRVPGSIPAPDGAEDGDGGEGDMDADGDGIDEVDGEDSDDAPSIAPTTGETEDGLDVSSQMTMEAPTAQAIERERAARMQMQERSKEDMDFPDEVDTPVDQPARQRFQKYRGLKSFRTSPWDPYEDLPVEYSRIFEFEGFASTGRAFRDRFVDECAEIGEGGTSGHYCSLYLTGVPPSVISEQPSGVPFVLSSLFEGEQKVTMVHGRVTRHGEHEETVKSKQEVALHCGFRRLVVRPIFSEIPKRPSTCTKYKFSRYFHPETTSCVSFYAPTIFPPCNMMMFTPGSSGQELIGSGAVTGCDPKQLIIKRVVLTGYPFRTHKSKGVCRFMFFNPLDVKWFKPVELSTKKGLRGHISESLGTHGYMKCRFSGHVKQDDIVCMNLFKRAYPKWHPPSWGGSIEDKPDQN